MPQLTQERGRTPETSLAVRRHRTAKLGRIDQMLDLVFGENGSWCSSLSADLPLRYALAHHILEAVEDAARRQDDVGGATALRLRRDPAPLHPMYTATGTAVVARALESELIHDRDRSETPVALLNSTLCAAVSDAQRDLVREALSVGRAAGFGELLGRNARVIVLLEERQFGGVLRSWTTSRLPATTHLDFYPSPHFVTRDLIHEAAHTDLNDLLDVFDVRFPPEARYFAPWRGSERPVSGFLHGVWAFSHVTSYCDWLAQSDAPTEVRALAHDLVTHHGGEVESARDDSQRALDDLPCPEIAEMIAARRDEALGALARHRKSAR